jgi:hypothetical protein
MLGLIVAFAGFFVVMLAVYSQMSEYRGVPKLVFGMCEKASLSLVQGYSYSSWESLSKEQAFNKSGFGFGIKLHPNQLKNDDAEKL